MSVCTLALVSITKKQRQNFQIQYASNIKTSNFSQRTSFSLNSQLHETSERESKTHYPLLISVLIRKGDLAGGGIEPPTFGL